MFTALVFIYSQTAMKQYFVTTITVVKLIYLCLKLAVDQCDVYKENDIRMNSIDRGWLSHKINCYHTILWLDMMFRHLPL